MKSLKSLNPSAIVGELDKFIIGQNKAKRFVAIALRNRWRRQQVTGELHDEIMPNNIILIGPTGVGKTEIARRLSRLAGAPFIKVEASKYTEVGYVGRDVESMVRELMDLAVNETREEMTAKVNKKAIEAAKERILDLLLPPPRNLPDNVGEEQDEALTRYRKSREKMRKLLEDGKLDDREVEVEQNDTPTPSVEVFSNMGFEAFDFNIGEMISNMLPFKRDTKPRKMKVPQAIAHLVQQEESRMVSKEKVIAEAKARVENHGIIFIDEIDKIASSERDGRVDVSRSGVQRDLLPIVEGSNVPTKHGIVNTSHILFIAAGAFHTAKPSDLIPEMQGRFPIRVELASLTRDDFEKILQYPKNALIKQYKALFLSEGVKLEFEPDAISEIAAFAARANEKMEDIGARRLHTIMNTLLEDYLFDMPVKGLRQVMIDSAMVTRKLEPILNNEDLSKYIL